MKLPKAKLLLLTISMSLLGTAYAQTCYDPNYGYFNCARAVRYVQTCYDPYYGYYNCGYRGGSYYGDPGAAVAEGAFFGFVLGSAFNNGNYYNHGGYWHGGRGGWGGHGGGWGGGHGGWGGGHGGWGGHGGGGWGGHHH